MSTESTLSFRRGLFFLAAWMVGGFLWGAGSDYVALFSAEQEDYRRILIDGVGNCRVEVDLDNLGHAEIKVWGIDERDYVGRRVYENGHFIPVIIRVDFPRNNFMSITVSGTRFRDYVRYEIVDSDIYIIDLYARALPRESYFREETISALWPGGRFQPDIAPAAQLPALVQSGESQPPIVTRTLSRGMIPYRRIILRAVVWATCVSGLLLTAGLILMWFMQRRKSAAAKSATVEQAPAAGANQPSISDARVRAFMALDGSLSYDEATLLTALGEPKPSTRPRS